MKGFKGFDKDFSCRGFQFEEGKTYTEKEAVICERGFHFCTDPFDVLNYYNICDSTFAEVLTTGKTVKNNFDSKVATTKIKIVAKLSLAGFVKALVEYLLKSTTSPKGTASSGDSAQLASSGDSAKLASSGDCAQLASSGDSAKLASSGHSAKLASSGYYAQLASSGHSAKLASSGYSAQLASSGDCAQLASSGDCAKLEMNGVDSVGAAIGVDNKIKGCISNWITLAEWEYDAVKARYIPICVKSARIDGKKIKADIFYQLVGGKFVEVKP